MLLRKRIKRINEKMQLSSSGAGEQAAEQLSSINSIKERIRALRRREPGDAYEEAIRWLNIDNTPVPALRKRLRHNKVATDQGLTRAGSGAGSAARKKR